MEFHMFQFVPVASSTVAGYSKEESGSLVFIPKVHQVFTFTEKIPLELSVLKAPGPSHSAGFQSSFLSNYLTLCHLVREDVMGECQKPY